MLNFEEKIKYLSYLYDGSNPNWVLLKSEITQGQIGYLIYNKKTEAVKLLDSWLLSSEIKYLMQKNGCEVLEREGKTPS